MSIDYELCLGQAKERREKGASAEDLMAFFRENGASPVDSIKMLRDVFGWPLAEAKKTLHFSETWRDMQREHEELHENVLKAAKEAGFKVRES